MKLYEYCIIYTPTRTEAQVKAGEKVKSVLLVDVTRVLCDDDKQAAMLAARAVPDEYVDKLERIEIAIRPF